MDSDSSSSDSDTSFDSVFDEYALKSLQVMKNNIKANSSPKCQSNTSNTNTSHKVTYNHKKIYETFNQSSSTVTSSNSSKSNKTKGAKTVKNNSEKSNEIKGFDFFIDNGPSKTLHTGDSENISMEPEVFTIDLSGNKSDNSNDSGDDKNANQHETQSVNTDKLKKKKKKHSNSLSSRMKCNIKSSDIYVNIDPAKNNETATYQKIKHQKHKEPEIMKKCVISDDYEKQDAIVTTQTSVRQLKKQRKLESEKTKGDKWFNMAAPEMTEETKQDLMVLQMRKALDPKRFYKANDFKAPPKFFQFGTVVESAADFYHSRLPKKQRKSNIVEELLADAEFRKYNKRKYEEIQVAKRQGTGPYQRMKKLKTRQKKGKAK